MEERLEVNSTKNQSVMDASEDSRENGRLAESLSALMDGEAGELELRRVLRAMDDEGSELMARWRRYHLVQASLHDQTPPVRTDLLAGIHARLQNEAPISSHSALIRQARKFAGRLGQGAIAAGVAAAVLFGAGQLDQQLRGAEAPGLAGSAATGQDVALLPELGGEYNPSALTRTVSMGAAERDRIQRAVQQFSGQAPAVRFNEVYTFPVQADEDEEAVTGAAGQGAR